MEIWFPDSLEQVVLSGSTSVILLLIAYKWHPDYRKHLGDVFGLMSGSLIMLANAVGRAAEHGLWPLVIVYLALWGAVFVIVYDENKDKDDATHLTDKKERHHSQVPH